MREPKTDLEIDLALTLAEMVSRHCTVRDPNGGPDLYLDSGGSSVHAEAIDMLCYIGWVELTEVPSEYSNFRVARWVPAKNDDGYSFEQLADYIESDENI